MQTPISVKEIEVAAIDSKSANSFIKAYHYSGKVVTNSRLHFGCFYKGKLIGVLSFGSSLDKNKMLGLVEGAGWNEFVELNRMAFVERMPKNTESRCISICIKLIRKNCPQIKWIVSYADGAQCGDGAVYRACGFLLTLIKPNSDLCKLPNGTIIHSMTLKSSPLLKRPELGNRSFFDVTDGRNNFKMFVERMGGEILKGYQLRYIYLIDKNCKLKCPILPYSRINEIGAGMYKGERIDRRA